MASSENCRVCSGGRTGHPGVLRLICAVILHQFHAKPPAARFAYASKRRFAVLVLNSALFGSLRDTRPTHKGVVSWTRVRKTNLGRRTDTHQMSPLWAAFMSPPTKTGYQPAPAYASEGCCPRPPCPRIGWQARPTHQKGASSGNRH